MDLFRALIELGLDSLGAINNVARLQMLAQDFLNCLPVQNKERVVQDFKKTIFSIPSVYVRSTQNQLNDILVNVNNGGYDEFFDRVQAATEAEARREKTAAQRKRAANDFQQRRKYKRKINHESLNSDSETSSVRRRERTKKRRSDFTSDSIKLLPSSVTLIDFMKYSSADADPYIAKYKQEHVYKTNEAIECEVQEADDNVNSDQRAESDPSSANIEENDDQEDSLSTKSDEAGNDTVSDQRTESDPNSVNDDDINSDQRSESYPISDKEEEMDNQEDGISLKSDEAAADDDISSDQGTESDPNSENDEEMDNQEGVISTECSESGENDSEEDANIESEEHNDAPSDEALSKVKKGPYTPPYSPPTSDDYSCKRNRPRRPHTPCFSPNSDVPTSDDYTYKSGRTRRSNTPCYSPTSDDYPRGSRTPSYSPTSDDYVYRRGPRTPSPSPPPSMFRRHPCTSPGVASTSDS